MTGMINCADIERGDIEQAVLGSMAFLPEAAEFAASELSGSEFSHPSTRAMFRTIVSMVEAGTAIDAITLGAELSKRDEFELVGGAHGIMQVLDAVPHAAHCRFYVKQLQETYQRDQLKQAGERLTARAQDQTRETSETIESVFSEMEAIRAGGVLQQELKTTLDAIREADSRESDTGKIIPTGLSELDRQLNRGMRGGQLIVIGGRPGTGKSVLQNQILINAAMSHRPGLIASLEMTAGEIAERYLKAISRQRLEELPVLFSECSEFSKLVALLRLAKRRHGIQLAAVDYLQLIESPLGRNEIRERQIAMMSRGLKRLAMELQIPILLGSQLNRESEKRGRPSLADLRESGAIEQDADIVILISGDAESDERELIVAKHRGGPCGLVKATFDRPRFKFSCEPWTGSL